MLDDFVVHSDGESIKKYELKNTKNKTVSAKKDEIIIRLIVDRLSSFLVPAENVEQEILMRKKRLMSHLNVDSQQRSQSGNRGHPA